jgi:2-iminobutanoate/2-iminopropanoate deaminase
MANSNRKVVLTQNAPQPIGPYSQAVRMGEWLFCSGQIAIDPKDGQIHASDVEGQTKQVMENLQAVLIAGGASCASVVKTTIFLKSMGDFPKVNEIYGTYFRDSPPARSTVEVARLPKDVLVEVEAIAKVEG